jgi:hypothetical protein
MIKNDDGAATVEFGIVMLPLSFFLALLIGGGFLLAGYQSVTNAAYEGARYAALGSSQGEVQDRVKAMVSPLTTVKPPVVSPGCDPDTHLATVTVDATLDAIFFTLEVRQRGVEKCA